MKVKSRFQSSFNIYVIPGGISIFSRFFIGYIKCLDFLWILGSNDHVLSPIQCPLVRLSSILHVANNGRHQVARETRKLCDILSYWKSNPCTKYGYSTWTAYGDGSHVSYMPSELAVFFSLQPSMLRPSSVYLTTTISSVSTSGFSAWRLRGYPADRTHSPVERVIIIGRFNSGTCNRRRILWRWCHGERGPDTTENSFTRWFLDKRHSSCGCGTLDACQPLHRTPNFRDVCFRSMFKLNHRTGTTAWNSFSEIRTGHPDVGVAGDGI